MDRNSIVVAANNLASAKVELGDAMRNEMRARFNLEAEELSNILADRVQGSNSEKRKAHLAALTQEARDVLQSFELTTARARMVHDVAALRWEQVNLELRLAELTAAQNPDVTEQAA